MRPVQGRTAQKLATSQTPIAKLWRKLQARDKKTVKALTGTRKGMNFRQKQPSVFAQIKAGLKDSIAYSRGRSGDPPRK